MATYTDINGVKLITTGDEAGTWGSSTNVNLQIIERAANGFAQIALTGTSYTLTLSNQPSAAENGHYKAIEFTGTPGGTCTVTLGQNDHARAYLFLNSTDQTVTISQGSGSNVDIVASTGAIVLADGAGSGAAVKNLSITASAFEGFTGVAADLNYAKDLRATGVTTTEFDKLDGLTASTSELNKMDGVTATTAELNKMDGVTATTAELNYTDGVTSSIQTQLDAKLPLSGGTVTGQVKFNDNVHLDFGTGNDAEIYHNGSHLYFDMNADDDIIFRDGNNSNATRFTFDTSSGNFTATGNITAYSDAALKSDITTIDNALEKVSNMRGVFFNKDGERGTGVVAQEVQKVIPEAVFEGGEYLSVAYGNLVGVLVEAIKDLKTQVEDLKNDASK